jgi:hypothetical protein
MSTSHGNGSLPPFIENEKEHPHSHPPPAETKIQEPANLIIMLIGWIILTIALVGGAKVLLDILSQGLDNTGALWAQIAALSVAFIVGWFAALLSIRSLHNLILPFVIRLYALFISLGIAGVYLRVVSKLLLETFGRSNYLRYSIVLIGLFLVLAALHLLIEDHDARPFSVPILLAALFHLVAIVGHYVFMPNSNPNYIVGDMYFFIFALILAVLIATNLFLVKPLQRMIDKLFPANGITA